MLPCMMATPGDTVPDVQRSVAFTWAADLAARQAALRWSAVALGVVKLVCRDGVTSVVT